MIYTGYIKTIQWQSQVYYKLTALYIGYRCTIALTLLTLRQSRLHLRVSTQGLHENESFHRLLEDQLHAL